MQSIGMARGFIVVDADSQGLTSALEKMNFHVVSVDTPKEQGKKGDPDMKIIKEKLGGRILVTGNPDDFVEFAPIYDFGIISLKGTFQKLNRTVGI